MIKFKVCAKCYHVFLVKPCDCEVETYDSVWANGLKWTFVNWLKGWFR